MDEGTWEAEFPADLIVEIMLRLPANTRRCFRLVCRSWRDLVDHRTGTDLRSRATTLVVGKGSASVLDDPWGLWNVWASDDGGMAVVGTSNGLLCLCDNTEHGGAVALANPRTGERLAIPLLTRTNIFTRLVRRWRRTCPSDRRWHAAYGFAYHQATGRYKIVHVPCCFDRVSEFPTLQVFTLGEASPLWRDVATPPGVGCDLAAGVVSVDGATYWVVDGTHDVMSFNHEDERVTSVKPLPLPLPAKDRSRQVFHGRVHLAEVRGRVGVAVTHWLRQMSEKTEVWVLEDARGEQRWSRWFSLQIHMWRRGLGWDCHRHQLTLPHFAHGKHVLTNKSSVLYMHKLRGTRRKRSGALQIGERDGGTVIPGGDVCQAFAHVETAEPLGVYRRW